MKVKKLVKCKIYIKQKMVQSWSKLILNSQHNSQSDLWYGTWKVYYSVWYLLVTTSLCLDFFVLCIWSNLCLTGWQVAQYLQIAILCWLLIACLRCVAVVGPKLSMIFPLERRMRGASGWNVSQCVTIITLSRVTHVTLVTTQCSGEQWTSVYNPGGRNPGGRKPYYSHTTTY